MKLTYNEVATICDNFNKNWDDLISKTKVGVRSLYQIISFKKTIFAELEKIQEMATAIMKQYGAQPNDQGVLQIPPNRIEEADKALIDFGHQTLDIDCEQIELSDNDVVPVELLELLFGMIDFK